MAGVAYYNTGTATVAVNSKTVTGIGTNWLSVVGGLTAIKAGDKFGIHVGRPIIIASVDSNTQLTLEDNWPGPAQTNAAYKIELTSPDVIAVEAMRRVLGSLSGGILYGVSQLTAAPNKALTIDETGAVALADLTTFGKSLISVLNSSAAYGVLGEIPNGQLPARLRALPTFVNDWNNVRENGFYFGGPESANTPAQPWSFIGVVKAQSSSYCVQTLTALGVSAPASNVTFERQIVNNVPSAWFRVRYTEAELDARYNRLSQPVANAQLPDRLKDFGRSVIDWNAATESGVYFGETASNRPDGIDGELIGHVEAAASNAIIQTVTRWWQAWSTNSATWRRYKNGSGVNDWTPWFKLRFTEGELDERYNRLGVTILKDQLPNLMNATSFIDFMQAGVGSVGYLRMVGGNATDTGYADFRQANGARAGYIGAANGTQKDIQLTADNGYRFAFATSGGRYPAVDGQDIRTAATAYAKSETYTQAQTQSLVTTARQVRLGAQGVATTVIDQWTIAPSGSFLTAMRVDGIYAAREVAYRAVQQTDVSGNWVTVAQV